MADSLFLMQRYLGSDDEDVTVSSTDKLEKIIKKTKRKRMKQEGEGTIESIADISTEVETSGSSELHLGKKKNKRIEVSNLDVSKGFGTRDEAPLNTSSVGNVVNSKNIDNNSPSPARSDVKYGLSPDSPSKKRKRKREYSECNGSALSSPTNGNLSSENDVKLTSESAEQNQSQSAVTEVDDNRRVKRRKRNPQQKDEISDSLINDKESPESCETDDSGLYPIIKDVLNKNKAVIHRSLPDWLANPTILKIDLHDKKKSIQKFDFLSENTKANLLKNGIEYLFPVQEKVIPWLLQSNVNCLLDRPSDLCVSAPTGSGKTLAFVIPIVQSLKERTVSRIRALVVLPVGELAIQVYKVFESFCKGTDLQVALAVGLKSFPLEQSSLVRKCTRGFFSQADIIVATPGRLLDHIDRTPGFTLQHLRFLVIDEADRMMDEIERGWLKKVENAVYSERSACDCSRLSFDEAYKKRMLSSSCACAFGNVSEPLQKLFYSATLSQDPEKLHELALHRPKLFTSALKLSVSKITVSESNSDKKFIGVYTTPTNLVEQYVVCDVTIKPLIICHLVKENQFKKVLCFTQSLEHSHRLHLVLSEMLGNMEVRELSSNLGGMQRKTILRQFLSGEVSILVCSDLMARGMDINDVDCVISYDMPHFIKTYIHRIGRTARAGKKGIAITLLEKSDLHKFKRMLTMGSKVLPVKIDVIHKSLLPMEEGFKKALAAASRAIADEKRNLTLLKKGVKNKKSNIANGFKTAKKNQKTER